MWFSRKAKGMSVALLDIGSGSVGGSFVRLQEGQLPIMCYTVRVPIETVPDADDAALAAGAMHALEAVGDRLVREGAPALRAAVGDGSVDQVLVSLGSPWQEATVETKTVRNEEPFVFTRSFAVDALGPSEEIPGRNTTRTLIATLLNGYLTKNPYGMRASRAEVFVLSTSLDESMMESVDNILRSCFHTRDIRYVSFIEPAYRSLQELYPHERDFLLLSVTGETTDIVSVKRKHLIDTGSIACGDREFKTDGECAKALSGILRGFASRHALPRTVFLLAQSDMMDIVRTALDTPAISALWLSEEPVTIISLEPSRFSALLRTQGLAEGDAPLAMLGLYAGMILRP